MRSLIVCLFSFLVFSVFAATPQQVQDKAFRLSQFLERNAHRLSDFEISKTNAYLEKLLQELNVDAYPQPGPHPGPQPGPQPGPGRQVSAVEVILATAVSSYSNHKVNSIKKAIQVSGVRRLQDIIRICDSYSYSSDELACLQNFLQSSRGELIQKPEVKNIMLEACAQNSYSSDQFKCLQSVANASELPRIKQIVQNCNASSSYTNYKVDCVERALQSAF